MVPTLARRMMMRLLVVACFLWATAFTVRGEPSVRNDENQEQNDWLVELHSNLFQAAQNDPEKLESLIKNAHHQHHHPYLRNLDSVHNSESNSYEKQQRQLQQQRETSMGGNGGGYGNGGPGNDNGYGGGYDTMMGGGGMGGGGHGNGGGMGGGGNGNGHGHGKGHSKYGKVIMALFNSAQANLIERVVTPLYNSTNKKKRSIIGVETTTTSSDPTVAANIQTHVSQMKELLEGGGAIHRFDPLFAAMAQDNAVHHLDIENLESKGVHVQHIGSTPCGVALIQAHAAVVSAFIEKGHDEAMRTHAVPEACN